MLPKAQAPRMAIASQISLASAVLFMTPPLLRVAGVLEGLGPLFWCRLSYSCFLGDNGRGDGSVAAGRASLRSRLSYN